MAVTTKTWNFAADSQGLSDAGDSTSMSFAYGDGDVRFTLTGAYVGASERAVGNWAETFRDWGVPAGCAVTHLQIKSYSKQIIDDGATFGTWLDHISVFISQLGETPHRATASNLVDTQYWTNVIDDDPVPQAGGSKLEIDVVGSQVPATCVCGLVIKHSARIYASNTSVVAYDDIVLEITHTEAGTGDTIEPNDCVHAVTDDGDVLIGNTNLVIASCYHSPESSMPVLETGLEVLNIDSCTHAHTVTVCAVTGGTNLVIADCVHAHTSTTTLDRTALPGGVLYGDMVTGGVCIARQVIGNVRIVG
jgi:hypothetical protein